MVVVTFYPNFNMALDDPQLHNFLKVQLQITGVDQVLDTYQATLHYQMAYRVQNHAFDLVLPVTHDACLSLLIPIKELPVLMSRGKSRKRTYKSYSLLLGLQIMKSCIKALSLYNPQNPSSPKKLMVLLKSSSRKENLPLLHQVSFPPPSRWCNPLKLLFPYLSSPSLRTAAQSIPFLRTAMFFGTSVIVRVVVIRTWKLTPPSKNGNPPVKS